MEKPDQEPSEKSKSGSEQSMKIVKRCSHGNCDSDSRYGEDSKKPRLDMIGVKFFTFPRGKQEKNEWVKRCNRTNYTLADVKKNHYVCSKHFLFLKNGNINREYPLPTYFDVNTVNKKTGPPPLPPGIPPMTAQVSHAPTEMPTTPNVVLFAPTQMPPAPNVVLLAPTEMSPTPNVVLLAPTVTPPAPNVLFAPIDIPPAQTEGPPAQIQEPLNDAYYNMERQRKSKLKRCMNYVSEEEIQASDEGVQDKDNTTRDQCNEDEGESEDNTYSKHFTDVTVGDEQCFGSFQQQFYEDIYYEKPNLNNTEDDVIVLVEKSAGLKSDYCVENGLSESDNAVTYNFNINDETEFKLECHNVEEYGLDLKCEHEQISSITKPLKLEPH